MPSQEPDGTAWIERASDGALSAMGTTRPRAQNKRWEHFKGAHTIFPPPPLDFDIHVSSSPALIAFPVSSLRLTMNCST